MRSTRIASFVCAFIAYLIVSTLARSAGFEFWGSLGWTFAVCGLLLAADVLYDKSDR